jgi:hypothetical protein
LSPPTEPRPTSEGSSVKGSSGQRSPVAGRGCAGAGVVADWVVGRVVGAGFVDVALAAFRAPDGEGRE